MMKLSHTILILIAVSTHHHHHAVNAFVLPPLQQAQKISFHHSLEHNNGLLVLNSSTETRQEISGTVTIANDTVSPQKVAIAANDTPSPQADTTKDDVVEIESEETDFNYVQFAKDYPFANNIIIAASKTTAADLLAQTVIGGTPITEIDVQRSILFCLFGALYSGGFQYVYQVQIFKRIFDVNKFTQQSWKKKFQDTEGLKALAAQTALDLTVLTLVYLPTFYIFKASVFSGSMDPSVWFSTGFETYQANFAKDESDALKVWFPADLVCFSVPLYLRLPVRHIVSFVWTAYLSFARGGH